MQLCNMAELSKRKWNSQHCATLWQEIYIRWQHLIFIIMYKVQLYKEDWTILHMLGCQAIALPSTEQIVVYLSNNFPGVQAVSTFEWSKQKSLLNCHLLIFFGPYPIHTQIYIYICMCVCLHCVKYLISLQKHVFWHLKPCWESWQQILKYLN